jgi:signal transduction histidine kinase
MQSEEKKLICDVGGRLYNLLKGKIPEKIDLSKYTDETEREFLTVVNEFIESFSEAQLFAQALSNGQLNHSLPKPYNLLSSSFKQLHSQLIHLTWQAERIAAGDYNQRVDFMGDFSKAFNSMIVKLADREKDLKKAHDELEIKVKQRTAELARTNELLSQDIVKRKQAEEQLKTSIGELTRLNEQLQDFAHIAAHDLKTPLRGIGTLACWIAEDYHDKFDEQGRQQVKLLVRRVERMNKLIDCILRYSEIKRTYEKEGEIDLNFLLSEVIDKLQLPANIEMTIENHLPVLICEKELIKQVFECLLGNAVKYLDKPKGRVIIGCSEEHNFWKFRITDNGQGIEEKHFGRIFKIFQTLSKHDEFDESAGVGLTIAKQIIESYNGKIWVESTLHEGSSFFFTFPKHRCNIAGHVELEANIVTCS